MLPCGAGQRAHGSCCARVGSLCRSQEREIARVLSFATMLVLRAAAARARVVAANLNCRDAPGLSHDRFWNISISRKANIGSEFRQAVVVQPTPLGPIGRAQDVGSEHDHCRGGPSHGPPKWLAPVTLRSTIPV